MAKLTITFENGEIKKELLFEGEIFAYTMKTSGYGMKGDKPCILSQFEDKYGCDNMTDELIDYVDNIDVGDEGEIQAAIDYLSSIEE
ncbi:hypothetical protein [Intestinibacter bartlettii]|uniref:hypothetical protein n=1 Tax=Intestinibacter bartlettii TaxID=261299 RepID=UPI003AB84CD3